MTKNNKKAGAPMPASKMSLVQLQELAVQLKIMPKEVTDKTKKKDILLAITQWEEANQQKEDGEGHKILGNTTQSNANEVVDMFQGKKVIKRTPAVINGKNYEHILVETGETFTELVTE